MDGIEGEKILTVVEDQYSKKLYSEERTRNDKEKRGRVQ